MTIVAERKFLVTVKVEAPNVTALDEATASVLGRLQAAVPGRLSGLRVIWKEVVRQ